MFQLFIVIAVLLFGGAADAQSISTARMGINPVGPPWSLYAYDPTGNWAILSQIQSDHTALTPSYPIPASFFNDSGSNITDNCTTTAGSSTVTISNRGASDSGDWRVQQGFMCQGAGPSFPAGLNPSGLVAVQGGVTGGDTIQYAVSLTDQYGAISPATFTTITNANAATDINNPITLTMSSPSRVLPGIIWKQRNGGTWQYLGTQIPTYSVSLLSAGTGYTPGTYMWAVTGGDCLYEPFGYITVDATGAVSSVTSTHYWHGCATQDPTFVLPPAMGNGSGVVINFQLTWQFIDGGTSEQTKGTRFITPTFVPATPPTIPVAGFLQGAITAVNGNKLTVSLVAQTSQSDGNMRHDETVAINNCLASAAISGKPNATCQLSCGTHNILGSLNLKANWVGLQGGSQSRNCTSIKKFATGDTIIAPSGSLNNRIADILFSSSNQTDGWVINIQHPGGLDLTNLYYDHAPGGHTISYMNDLRLRHIRGASLWGPGYSDYDLEAPSIPGGQSGCCIDMYDVYSNDSGSWTDAKYNNTRRGHVINGPATIIGANNADSNVEGYGFWIDNTGIAAVSNQFRNQTIKSQFFQQIFASCEFSGLNCWHIDHSSRIYLTNSDSHAGYASDSVDIGINVNTFSWIGGFWTGAGKSCGRIAGENGSIVGVTFAACGGNNGGVAGTYPGVRVSHFASGVSIVGNHFGDQLNSWFSYPVQLDSITFTTASAYADGDIIINMQTANDGSVYSNMDVFDETTNRYLGTVNNYSGTVLTMNAAINVAGGASPAAGDAIHFSYGHNVVSGNSLFGAKIASNNIIHDLSFNPTNRIGINANDQAPGWQWNNVQQTFSIGGLAYGSVFATAGNNGYQPGLSIKFAHDNSDVRLTINNSTQTDNSSSSLFLSSNIPSAYAAIENLTNAHSTGADPTFNFALGAGMGKILFNATGGKYGNATSIVFNPLIQVLGNADAQSFSISGTAGVTCTGVPTSSFKSTNGIVTHC